MKEIAQIIELWRTCRRNNEDALLATVIRTRGSSYRLPGARLLLTRSGQRAGSVSGGCLEDDLIKKAWWLTESGSVVRRYDTTPDGEIGSGYGLGCNGIIHLHLERLTPSKTNVIDRIEHVWQTRRPATYQHPSVDGEPAFVETLQPPIRLVICGGGDDAIPLSYLAKFVGWQVHVYDGRSHYARRERFPHADQIEVREVGKGGELHVDARTVAVLMTHSYSQDLSFLQNLAANPPLYLGLLGPRKRSLQLLADAGLQEDQLAPALHAPMGLDIGADGPHQVALSALAEIQAYLNGREGGELRERVGPIHARGEADFAADDDPNRKFQVHSIACA
jgi:xanthine/CO dehydrogenase XdhC/CoxF family maturation factor